MEMQQLIYFQCVANTENISEAAEILHISQPALSMSIKNLETELEVKLFDRHKKSIKLNAYGVTFLEYTNRMIKEMEDGKNALDTLRSVAEKRVTIMCPPAIYSSALMSYLYENGVDAIIENNPANTTLAINGIGDGTLDFMVIVSSPKTDSMNYIPLVQKRLCAILNKNHRLANRESINLKELSNELFSTYPVKTIPRDHLEKHCKKCGFVPFAVNEGFNNHDILMPVLAGYAVAVLVPDTIPEYFEGLVSVPFDDDSMSVKYGIVYDKSKPLRPIVKKVIEKMVEFYSNK